MRKIDLAPYPRLFDETDEQGNVVVEAGTDYDKCALFLRRMLLAPRGDGEELAKAWPIATKLADGLDAVLLEDAEWKYLRGCFIGEGLRFGGNIAPLVMRVLEAPDVPVKEAE